MKYAVQMGSFAMIYVGSLLKIGSAFQELIVGGRGEADSGVSKAWTRTQPGDRICFCCSFKIRQLRLNFFFEPQFICNLYKIQ
jgi:hypothetical protein